MSFSKMTGMGGGAYEEVPDMVFFGKYSLWNEWGKNSDE
jgi:hypothetical protein